MHTDRRAAFASEYETLARRLYDEIGPALTAFYDQVEAVDNAVQGEFSDEVEYCHPYCGRDVLSKALSWFAIDI